MNRVKYVSKLVSSYVQLYVTLSRTIYFENIKIEIKPKYGK